MQSAESHSPLDDVLPHDRDRSEAQIRGVLQLLEPPAKRVLELGCGRGRLVVPLAQRGHYVTGIDRAASATSCCRAALIETGSRAEIIEADFLSWLRGPQRQSDFDAILCVGNAFMTVADLDEAIAVLSNARRLLAPGGAFILDDLPHDLWPQLTEGNWTSGISEDGTMQLVWHADDAVFTVRHGRRIDGESWTLNADDALYRLWTSGALRMAARLADLSEPQHVAEAGLLVLRRLRESNRPG